MAEFTNDAKNMLQLLGGKENVVSFTHCATRMRFVLRDNKKADIQKIEELSCVKGSFTQGGQFQVIIGNKVSFFYDEFVEVSGIDGVSKAEVKSEAKSNLNLLQRLLANLSEVFAPIIPAIIVGGLILGFRNVIGDISLLNGGTQTITQVYPFWQGVYDFLWLIGEAIFVFLPVVITYSVCKKMNADPVLGIVLGITLVSPQLMGASDYVRAVAEGTEIKAWDFGAFHINMVGYQSQVIPAILVGIVFSIIYKFLKRHVPEMISMIVVPFFSLVPSVLLAHTVIGPFGRVIGDSLAKVIQVGFDSSFSWLVSGIYGMAYPLLVITGLHHAMLPIDLQAAEVVGGIYTFPVVALNNIAQASAVVAFVLLHRKDERAKEVGIPSFISGYLGVTEPAMFGINLKYLYPFIGAMLANGVTGLISRSIGIIANSVGVGGLPAFLSMKAQYMLPFIGVMVINIVLSILFTIILSKTKLNSENRIPKEKTDKAMDTENGKAVGENRSASEEFIAPMTGMVYPINEIEDEAFSSGALGDGIAIEMEKPEVLAPLSGEIAATFPTKHAYGIRTDKGREVMIHLGMDTVELNGEGFECLVKAGDQVKQGDLIAKVDIDFVRSKGKSLISPVVFTDDEPVEVVRSGMKVNAGDKEIINC